MSLGIARSNQDFLGQTAIITGGASGLGEAVGKALLEAGVHIAIFDLSSPSPEVLNHPGAVYYKVDVTREAEVTQSIANVIAIQGHIHILVNCAGITGKTNIKTHETDIENIRKVFDINFYGSYLTAKYVLPYMLKNQYGRILHIASIAGKEGNAGMLAYSASKAAVIGMTKVQGKEYAETGVTINALAPAVIQTPLVDAMPAEQVKYMTDKIPMKRCGTLQEIADIVLFIVSPKNSFTTGFTFDMSGGRATY